MRKHDLPPLEALRAFDAAARHLSFTRAAGELFVTQSAVSKQVIALELALATRLFERRSRALQLTAAGERLLRATDSAFAELRAAAAELRGGDEPTVTLATTQAFASFWLIPRLADFRRSHPGIDIRISADSRLVDWRAAFVPGGLGPCVAIALILRGLAPVARHGGHVPGVAAQIGALKDRAVRGYVLGYAAHCRELLGLRSACWRLRRPRAACRWRRPRRWPIRPARRGDGRVFDGRLRRRIPLAAGGRRSARCRRRQQLGAGLDAGHRQPRHLVPAGAAGAQALRS